MASETQPPPQVLDDKERLSTLYRHYVSNVEYLRSLIKGRLLMAWGILAVVCLMAFFGIDAANTTNLLAVTRLNAGGLEFDFGILDPRLVNSALWAGLLAAVATFFHRSHLIDFQARYVGELEQRLDGFLGDARIDRERRPRPREFGHADQVTFGVFGGTLLLVVLAKMLVEVGFFIRQLPAYDVGTIFFLLFDLTLFAALAYQVHQFQKTRLRRQAAANSARRAWNGEGAPHEHAEEPA